MPEPLKDFDQVAAAAAGRGEITVAVAMGHDPAALEAAGLAEERGLARTILVGDAGLIGKALADMPRPLARADVVEAVGEALEDDAVEVGEPLLQSVESLRAGNTQDARQTLTTAADRLVEITQTLADPRGLSEGDALQMAQEGVPFYLLFATIHSTEVGNGQAIIKIAHRLATENSPEIQEILELAEGAPLPQVRTRMAARIFKEAFDQRAVLTLSTVGLLFASSGSAVGSWIQRYHASHPGEVVPHAGAIFDLNCDNGVGIPDLNFWFVPQYLGPPVPGL